MSNPPRLSPQGLSHQEVLARMRELRTEDARWQEGRTWSLVYNAGEDVRRLLAEAYTEFMSENGLSPFAFPSLRRFESEVLAIAAELFHGEGVAGTMTSGGTESILMAVKTARDFARAERGITEPEMVMPASVHPAFQKAAHYFGVKAVNVPVGPDFRADVAAMRAALTPRTVLMVGSAPAYPQGVVDPISELAALAKERGLLFHVDACLGGFLLPFARKLGHAIPDFDFAVPGVTSLSADLHKYGYAAKGASLVLYRTPELRRYQFFTYADWSGGIYASPSMAGTRPGGAIAAAWAILKYLGEEGYLRLTGTVLDTAKALREGIAAIPGLKLLGEPRLSIFAFGSDTLDVYALGDAMEARGWKLDRQMMPPALHLMVTPAHAKVVEPFLADLRACAAGLASGEPAPEGSAAMYGMLGAMPDRAEAADFIRQFMDSLYE
ncbi:aspartate aminotransferase family protein [Pyxidicoccus fallax]|uniref:Aspartate aminotransferase family protein n=1 Tax=Pyxidicoccus fallax TaxID=394095 RepID=A0A848LLP7_9BACT|nr:aspartate aminotransferase family protein [Pyxidicoccus fallax]NMO18666.1 aspartate aminotransferase family protein [Pyxidicoccus fallax]NPC84485.1 aspartate aminotransferase family protein [Pyxidicoccus fallax]